MTLKIEMIFENQIARRSNLFVSCADFGFQLSDTRLSRVQFSDWLQRATQQTKDASVKARQAS
jgi:hypothetical protein